MYTRALPRQRVEREGARLPPQAGGKVVAIDALADPTRLERLDELNA